MKRNPLHLLDGQNPRNKNEHFSVLLILLQCIELWKYFQTSTAGCFLKKGPFQLRPRIKAFKKHTLCIVHKQNYYFHFLGLLPANSLPSPYNICISFWSCSTMVLSIHCSVCAASIPGWFHVEGGGRHHICWVPSPTEVFGMWWNTPISGVSALPSFPRAAQPTSSSAIQTLKTSPVLCLCESHLSLSIHLSLKGLCILQTAWRWRVAGKMKNLVIYCGYIEQCIIYWVM